MLTNLQGFAVTDPLDLQFAESLDEPVTELIGASADLDLGHAEAQEDLLPPGLGELSQVEAFLK
jgi:hypothetical protein